MARPIKFNWVEIRKLYENGLSVNKLIKTYKLNKRTLLNKVYKEKWIIKKKNDSIVEVLPVEVLEKSEDSKICDVKKEENIFEKLEISVEKSSNDIKLIENNRAIIATSQIKIVKLIENGEATTLKDFKIISEIVKNIESVINPIKTTLTTQNQTNTQINNIDIKDSLSDFYKK